MNGDNQSAKRDSKVSVSKFFQVNYFSFSTNDWCFSQRLKQIILK